MSEWKSRAECRTADPDAFFPGKGDHKTARAALKICQRCEVVEACLEYALALHPLPGVWGGATERDRRKIRERRIG